MGDPSLIDMIRWIYNKFRNGGISSGGSGITQAQLDTALDSKVDKVAGKGLSTNDYTTADKSKVSTIGDKLDKGTYNGTAQDLKNAIDGKADSNHSHNWNDITGKPNDLATFSNLNVGTKNLVYNSIFKGNHYYSWSQEHDATFGKVMKLDRPGGGGNFQEEFHISPIDLSNKDLIFMVIAKPLTTGSKFNFGRWQETYNALNEKSFKKPLGNGWFLYYSKINVPNIGAGTLGLNSVDGSWLFYACGIFESKVLVDWSLSPEDIETTVLIDEVFDSVNNAFLQEASGKEIVFSNTTDVTVSLNNIKGNTITKIIKKTPNKITFTGGTYLTSNEVSGIGIFEVYLDKDSKAIIR